VTTADVNPQSTLPEAPSDAASPTASGPNVGDADDRATTILEVTAALYAERGVSATTVRDIAERAGITSGTLYHYFPSKDAITDRLLKTYLGDLVAAYRAACEGDVPPPVALRRLIRASLEVFTRHRAISEMYQNDARYLVSTGSFDYIQTAAADCQGLWMSVIKQGQWQGDFRSDIDPWLFYFYCQDGIWSVLRWGRAPTRREYSLDELVDNAVRIYLGGFELPAGGPA